MAVSWRSPSARMIDAVLFVGVTVVLSVVVSADQAGSRSPDVLAYLWAVGLGALMLIRRTMPRLVLGLTALGFFTYYIAGFPAVGVAVPISAALFSAAEAGHLRASVLTGAAVLTASTAFRVASGQSASFVLGYELASHAALIAAVIALGYSVRARRTLQRRTAQVVGLVTRQTAMDTAAHAREKRLRLARELHDSMGHSLSVASLFADVAREADGSRRSSALDQVRSAVSEAMTQLRSTVTLLRSADGEAPAEATLDDLPRLLEGPASAGYDVTLHRAEVSASPDVQTCVYRIVQESVTNTMRHSNATRIEVGLAAEDDVLEVTVRDNGSGGRAARFGAGHGIGGMRERAEALGGTLSVHSGSDGWRVRATLPGKARS
ncbi:sensor histidine kinase [Micromonospora sp. WMMD1102]|uniref:sensor histidine kinase n=1 Tax=Micromonospora sp. WMMD1102 TaxID=3016105 RepID=UPI0024157B71|nr:sensor histidine kinase [Micromonospora sp. WMMD1102]MDG4787871.1 sensor histidine kinase [Micromonospora sp. WMMD1102]